MSIQEIEITKIITDGGTESRPLNQQIVSEYAEIYKADPNKLPAPDVFFDGQKYWAGDGFHRVAAATLAELKSVRVNIHEGGRLQALKHSLGSNDQHGYRRSPADKRYAVTKALQEFKNQSDRSIAELCRVSPTLVGQVRQESTVQMDSSGKVEEEKRVGKDGKVRRVPRRQPDEQNERGKGAGQRVAPEPIRQAISAPKPTVPLAPEAHPMKEQANAVDAALRSLDGACDRVVAIATTTMTDQPGSARKVRGRLNDLRAQLGRIIKGGLPKKENLSKAA